MIYKRYYKCKAKCTDGEKRSYGIAGTCVVSIKCGKWNVYRNVLAIFLFGDIEFCACIYL